MFELNEPAESMLAKSPTALKVTLESLRCARTSGSLAETLEQEQRVSLRCFAGPDLAEGSRAPMIGKDWRPQWSPATLDAVSAADVALYFTNLGPRELRLAGLIPARPPERPATRERQLRKQPRKEKEFRWVRR